MRIANGSLWGLFTAFLLASTNTVFPQAAVSDTDWRKIVGPNACAECHKEEALIWKKTHHFTTFKAMPRSKEAREIADKMGIKRMKAKSLCLNCHFTTQEVRKKPKVVAGISCESCHSAGKDWEEVHGGYSGHKKKEQESKAEQTERWRKSESFGMIRPKALYKLAKNCYGCHVVPQEKLVNIGGHPAGSAFELVSWSQGEIRHNVWYSKGKQNNQASSARRRLLYIVGVAVELETALRGVAIATKTRKYAVRMAWRAEHARKRMAKIAKALPSVPELSNMVKWGHSAGLKLNNREALLAAAKGVANEALRLAGRYDGNGFGVIDGMIPGTEKYKGKPAS